MEGLSMGLGAAAGAAIAGGLASGAVGLVGSALQKGASSGGASAANAAQTGALAQARQDLLPYTTAGTNALGVASDLSGANGPDAATAAMANFYTSPGYQFRLDEGLRGINQGAAAQGAFRSGATVKAEENYAQGQAGQEFSNYYSRLYDLSKLGENAATGTASADVSTGAGIAGTDKAAAAQQGSIYGAAGQGLSSAVSGLFANPAVVNKLFGGGTSNPTTGNTMPGWSSSGYSTGADNQLYNSGGIF
jgi:hypothetical protein